MKKLLIALVFLLGNGLILGWTRHACLSQCFPDENADKYKISINRSPSDACYDSINNANCTDCNCVNSWINQGNSSN